MASVHNYGGRPISMQVNNRPMTAGGSVQVTDYPLPKNSLPPKSPMYTFPKDKSQNYIEQAQRMGRKMPGPGDYEIKSCFDTPKKRPGSAAMGGKGDRRSHLDDLIRSAKKTPGPGHFNPKVESRIVGGVEIKGDRISFLDE